MTLRDVLQQQEWVSGNIPLQIAGAITSGLISRGLMMQDGQFAAMPPEVNPTQIPFFL